MKRIVLFFVLTALVAGLMAIDVSGVQSGTWTLINSPYNVVGAITVPAADSLVIEPGVEVIAMGNYKITLEGNLHAVATEADSIRFYGNGGLYWGGLRFENEDRASLLDYCRISNTDDTNDYGIHAINSPIYIDHCCIDDHKKAVHFSALATANPNYQEIRNSKVANCEQHGILITDNSNVLVDNCEVTQCGLGSTFRGAIQLALQNSNYGCSPVLSNNWIHHNGKQGLTMGNLFDDPGMAPTVTNNIIEYNLTGVYIYKAQGTYHGNIIRHNFIENDPNSGAGVMLYGSSATGVFTQNQFYGNYCGIYLAMDATANLGDLNNASSDDDGMNEIHDNVFFNGNVYAINNTSASDVTAENNTWDSDDPTQIAVTIIDGNDDPAYGIVDFDPIYVQPTNGFISGNVGLNAGSGIIEDVIITAGTVQTSPAANGDFLLEVAPGTYDVEYALAYYDTIVVENVTVIAGQTTSGIDATLPVMLYPPRNLWYEVNGEYLLLHWDEPINNPCLVLNEYTVYLDGTVVGILPEVSYLFINLPPGGYVAGVSAVYEDGWESDIITTPINFTPNLPAPGNLTATVFDYNDVALEWEAPDTTRALEGYKIYRNDEMIHEITDPATTTYNDMGLDGGDYSYHVTAVYTSGESEPGNIQELTITLGPPLNFNAVPQVPNIMCTWDPPAQTRNITKYRVYNDGELIGETTTTFFVWLDPPNINYDLYCTAVYSDLYESPESNHVTGGSEAGGVIPAVTRLTGNYPNPFNPTTSISFDLAQAEHASLVVYNAKGEVVATLLNADMPAGSHSIHWDGTIDNATAVSGIYFYQLRTADYTQTRRMVLLK